MLVKSDPQATADVDQEDPNTHDITPGRWRANVRLEGLGRLSGNTALKAAKQQRSTLKDYVNTVGSVPWQRRAIGVSIHFK